MATTDRTHTGEEDAMSNELYLATTVDGIEIEVEVYEGATNGRRARAR